MKTILTTAAAAAIAMSAGLAYAEDTNPKGAGGATVKSVNESLKADGTNLGQEKKDSFYGGNNAPQGTFGAAVSSLNQASNN